MASGSGMGETPEEAKKRIDREAGITPKPSGKYTSPGGFIKIPTPKGRKKPGQ